jgi:hypothetical protein
MRPGATANAMEERHEMRGCNNVCRERGTRRGAHY